MKQIDDLRGTMVLVHPDLAADPYGKQNEFGVIIAADRQTDDVLVTFPKKGWGLYASDALLVLKDSEELFALLEDQAVTIDEAHRKMIHAMAVILHYDFEDAAKISLKICQEHPAIRELATEGLSGDLGREQEQEIGR